MKATTSFLPRIIIVGLGWLLACEVRGRATEQAQPDPAAARGYRWLTEKEYLPPDFDQQTFDQVWRFWPDELRKVAAAGSPEDRRRMAYERYGLTTRPGDATGKPLQYVVDDDGNWTMNCFACHGGRIFDRVIPGLPNANFELETLTEEIRRAKLLARKPLTRMDVGSWAMPLGTTRGLTNAVMFGVALMNYRDEDLNVRVQRPPPRMVHHDMDPPPWWNFHKRRQIYIDGFAEKGVRSLMQFMLVRENGPEQFREWESDFEDVNAFLESLRPPHYPFAIDDGRARKGESAFRAHCADCHGTYGSGSTYPARRVPLDELGTDRVRLSALTPEHRAAYGNSWFAHYGEHNTVLDPDGYMAPPLDGIWASAPYFHNGAVPTLWDVLHPDQRPVVWRRTAGRYDQARVGLDVERLDSAPTGKLSRRQHRQVYDTQAFGKNAAGHTYPDVLDESEKQAVLEYLKSL